MGEYEENQVIPMFYDKAIEYRDQSSAYEEEASVEITCVRRMFGHYTHFADSRTRLLGLRVGTRL